MKTKHEIILADDDEDDRMLIGTLLRQHCPECTITIAENGQELIQLLERPDGQIPSLILLDLNMPVLGGFDALQHIKLSDRLRTIPVVVLTTSEEPRDVYKSYEMGANAFLTKPSSHSDLKTMILQLRSFWLQLAQLPTNQY